MNMDDIAKRILGSCRKKLFRTRPIFKAFEPESNIDPQNLEKEYGFKFPRDLRAWLDTVGFGDLDEVLAIRAVWINVIDTGELKGHVIFAQDELGNFYSFSPVNGAIHYICRTSPEFAMIAENFRDFMTGLEQRDYRIFDWIDMLEVKPYDWSG